MDFKFTFFDYLTHPQNVETMNKYIDILVKTNETGNDLLKALKKYYEEFKITHFMPLPIFDDFIDNLIQYNKLSKDYLEKLKLRNIK